MLLPHQGGRGCLHRAQEAAARVSGGRLRRQRSQFEPAPPPRTADPASASRSNSSRARPSDMGSPDAEPPVRMNNNISLQVPPSSSRDVGIEEYRSFGVSTDIERASKGCPRLDFGRVGRHTHVAAGPRGRVIEEECLRGMPVRLCSVCC